MFIYRSSHLSNQEKNDTGINYKAFRNTQVMESQPLILGATTAIL